MQIYAEVSDLVLGDSPWLTAVPDNVGTLIRAASALVSAAVAGNSPTDPEVLRDATCAQVATWATSGIDPASGGLSDAAPVKLKVVGDARIGYDTTLATSTTSLELRQLIANGLCPLAIAILEADGLIGEFEIATGGCPVREATEIPSFDYYHRSF